MTEIIITVIIGAMYIAFYSFSLTWLGEIAWFLGLGIAYLLGNRALKAAKEYLAWKEFEVQLLQEAGIHVED